MIYQKFRPCELLEPFVVCYYSWQSEEAIDDTIVVESPPSGYCSIVFNMGDQYLLQNKKYEQLLVPRHFIAGQAIYSYKLFLKGTISLAGIVLKPTALSLLFDLPAFEYVEERVPLDAVFKRSLVSEVREKLQQANDGNDKVKVLEEFLLRHLQQVNPQFDFIDRVANLIDEKNGMVRISDTMKDVFMSRRNFERRFFKKVGLSPKYYARIRRMSYLANLIAGKKKVDWAAIFSECEYYDQSHFIKDFTEFTGRTPQQYLDENSELAKLIDKPKMNDIDY